MLTKEVILATDARVEELFAELTDPGELYARFEAVWEKTERNLKRKREERKRALSATRGRGRGRSRGRGRGAAAVGSRTVSPQTYALGADAMDVDPPAAKRVQKPRAVRRETLELENGRAEDDDFAVVPLLRARTQEPEPSTTTTTTTVPVVSTIEKSTTNPLKLARLSKTQTFRTSHPSTATPNELVRIRRERTPLLFPGRTFTLHLTPAPSVHPPGNRSRPLTTKKNSRGRIDLDALWAAHWKRKGRIGAGKEGEKGKRKGVEWGGWVRRMVGRGV
ncbi:hypothetical protein YB2330_003414 [Saitoella coloradoensis]